MADATNKALAWLSGNGEMHALVRQRDWSRHPLGPVESWPPSMLTTLGICLSSRFPMILWWGPEFRVLYNEAYAPTFGIKHPAAFGTPGAAAWAEIWPVIGPMLKHVARSGEATWSDDQLLFLCRSGYLEETYHTFSYSPVWGESGDVAGVFTAVTETTKRVLADRRLRTLREVGATTGKEREVQGACRAVMRALGACGPDVHFALIYLLDTTSTDVLRLEGALHVDADSPMAPPQLTDDGTWPALRALRAHGTVETLLTVEQQAHLPPGAFGEPSRMALTFPIATSDDDDALGVLVVGINSRRELDEDYRAFLQLVSAQVATSVAKTRALEEERQRAEALAALDRSKTVFFSNVSHEFRTPLTLMLGPLQDLLQTSANLLPAPARADLALVQRNATRLLKLVNTLLDFSRIEAGRIDAVYEPTEAGRLTADLASAFRSTIERAGMRLVVDCPVLAEAVYLDRDMWEKIVLNLLSNAFKYTMQGSISVRQTLTAEHLRLEISDTGCGIPAAELTRLFERFHRVAGVQGRTHEGSGIGLALVQELVKLHRGKVTVSSTVGKGTAFTVAIPRGKAHLPAAHVQRERTLPSTGLGADAFVQEALRWVPSDHDDAALGPTELPAVPYEAHRAACSTGARPPVLVADDNADMRAYLTRLLSPLYDVTTVANGEAALREARLRRPDVIVSDIMMPKVDGLGLLAALREDPEINTIPVILLSARAGEEARVEGLKSGADDYLVKPFSARELLARVSAHLTMAGLRREADARERQILAQSAAEQARLLARERAAVRYRDEFLGIASHELRTPLTSITLQLQLTERALERVGGDVRKVPPERFRKMVVACSQQVNNLTALIDDLLDVSRIANGRLTIEPRNTDLGALVEDILGHTQEQLENAACEVTFSAEPNLVGRWDPKRLEQVVINLLSNATKYAAGTPVHVRVCSEGNRALLRVRDHGTGIPLDAQAKVFDRFERVGNDGNISGLGLGLYIVKEIVKAHKGDIQLTSAPGQGAEFVVQLPFNLSAPPSSHSAPVST